MAISMSSPTTAAQPRAAASRRRWRLWLGVGLVVVAIAAGAWGALGRFSPAEKRAPVPRSLPASVSALGRLAPSSEVIAVSPPAVLSTALGGSRVERLLVEVGDRVEAGQVVAILDTRDRRAALVDEAQAKVEVARAKVAQVQTGAEAEEIRVQEAAIRRSRADLALAQDELDRSRRLYGKGAATREELTIDRLEFEQAQATLDQAQAQLEALRATRPVDVEVAEAELVQAEAGLAIAQQDLKDAEVRTPIAGRVLRIHARAGEGVKDEGILEVGNTDVMHVVAEVYEADIGRVRLGQKARVFVPTLGAQLSGEVVSKNLIVARQDIFNDDPVADIDARIVEVRIRLSSESSARVAALSNARAEVVIDVAGDTH